MAPMMQHQARSRRTAFRLGGLVLFMLGASFAAVPFYDWFCRVTGYGGTTAVASGAAPGVIDHTIEVRFDANRSPDMPWEFRPLTRTVDIRLGETGLVFYEAYNPTDEPVAGTASYNVAPYSAGIHFAKIACFCFELQVLGPGERIEMPVSFFVDPRLIDEVETRGTKSITLSYTMHRSELPEDHDAEAQAASAAAEDRLRLAQAARLPP
ncbi:cytochrome c oxidase assembly protein [soil metagenome]